MVESDINGDGHANDRAFVFDPRLSPESELSRAMSDLFRQIPGSSRDCLKRQFGTVAQRNSCRSPWTSSLDAQINVFPMGRRNRRLMFTITAQNTAAGLDYLIHRSDNLAGWGQNAVPNPILLRVRGFDPANRVFRYDVNPDFGGRIAGLSGSRVPFTLRIQARVSLGADPAAQGLRSAVAALSTVTNPSAIRSHFQQHIPNIPAQILAAGDSLHLGLTDPQRAKLGAAADSLTGRIAAVVDRVAQALSKPESTRSADEDVDQLVKEGQSLIDEGIAQARATLTPAQWSRLPRKYRKRPRRMPRPSVSLSPQF
jgi:hypothetical protein